MRRPGSSARGLFLIASLAGVCLAGCGSESSADSGEAEPLGQDLGGSVAHLAQCSDWNAGSQAEKLATIADIRSQVNREDAGVSASSLTDEQAMEVLDNGCSNPGSDGFRLHIMYARAAAFEPLRRIVDGEAEKPEE